jgi:hypothetical protein
MFVEENRTLARKSFEAINRQFEDPQHFDGAALDEFLSPGWADEIRSWFPGLNRLWPDHHIEITDMVTEGNMVWCRLATRGTHCGEWEGILANGRRWTRDGIWYLTIVDHRIVDIECLYDDLRLVRQLGGTITPPQS